MLPAPAATATPPSTIPPTHQAAVSSRRGLDLVATDFPKRLAALRNERGMTQVTLPQHVGIHVSQFRRYEASTSSPTLNVLRKLAIAPVRQLRYARFDAERDCLLEAGAQRA